MVFFAKKSVVEMSSFSEAVNAFVDARRIKYEKGTGNFKNIYI